MIVWTMAVRSCEEAIQYRNGIGTETTHWRVGTQGITRSTRCAAVWAIRRPAHDGQNPRRLQLKASSISCLQVSHPRRRKTMGETAALTIVVKLTLHISRQACGIGIGIERGEKGFKMCRDHFIEDR